MSGAPQVMIDAAAWVVARDFGYPSRADVSEEEWRPIESQTREMLEAALAAAPTEPAGLLVTAPGGDEWFDRRAVDVALAEQVAGHEQIRRKVVPLWVHPSVPDGETARLREAVERATASLSLIETGQACYCDPQDEGHTPDCPSPIEAEVTKAADVLRAALSAGDTTGKCHNAVIAVDALLPESGEERDALVEVMQDAIFGAFDIDSGAREFAFAAYEALRDTLRDTPVGGTPANTTEEQG